MCSVEMRQMVKVYSGFQLGPIGLQIPRGHLVGLVGPNGAGKTTMINVMSGLVKADSGDVLVLGKEIGKLRAADRARIGLVRDEPALAEHAHVHRLLQFASQFYPLWDSHTLEDWLTRFRIDRNKKVKELSKGTKLKLHIAMALSHEVEVLLLDEPFSGLDLVAKADLREALQRIREGRTTSILLSSHDIDEIERLCDTVVLLSGGNILCLGSPEDLMDKWEKWEFCADALIQPPPSIRANCRDRGNSVWIVEGNGADTSNYLNQHHATNVRRTSPSLEEIFTILLSEEEVP